MRSSDDSKSARAMPQIFPIILHDYRPAPDVPRRFHRSEPAQRGGAQRPFR